MQFSLSETVVLAIVAGLTVVAITALVTNRSLRIRGKKDEIHVDVRKGDGLTTRQQD